jgi:hypothetical protein
MTELPPLLFPLSLLLPLFSALSGLNFLSSSYLCVIANHIDPNTSMFPPFLLFCTSRSLIVVLRPPARRPWSSMLLPSHCIF